MEETKGVPGKEIPAWWGPILVVEEEVISLLAAGHAAAFLREPNAPEILQMFIQQADRLIYDNLTYEELARAYFRHIWDTALVRGNMLAQSALSIQDEEPS